MSLENTEGRQVMEGDRSPCVEVAVDLPETPFEQDDSYLWEYQSSASVANSLVVESRPETRVHRYLCRMSILVLFHEVDLD